MFWHQIKDKQKARRRRGKGGERTRTRTRPTSTRTRERTEKRRSRGRKRRRRGRTGRIPLARPIENNRGEGNNSTINGDNQVTSPSTHLFMLRAFLAPEIPVHRKCL